MQKWRLKDVTPVVKFVFVVVLLTPWIDAKVGDGTGEKCSDGGDDINN